MALDVELGPGLLLTRFLRLEHGVWEEAMSMTLQWLEMSPD